MQDIICLITISSVIDPDLVEMTWTRDDSSITTNSRVTIIPTNVTENPSSFTYTTTIQFAYLMEGDEGNYTCNVAVEDMTESKSIVLQNLTSMLHNLNICMFISLLTVPSPIVEVATISTVQFGIAAVLECNAIAARGITSRVNIIWIRVNIYNYTTVRIVENVTASIISNSTIYTDQLVTPPLSVNDSGRVYYCVVTLNRSSYYDYIILDFISK